MLQLNSAVWHLFRSTLKAPLCRHAMPILKSRACCESDVQNYQRDTQRQNFAKSALLRTPEKLLTTPQLVACRSPLGPLKVRAARHTTLAVDPHTYQAVRSRCLSALTRPTEHLAQRWTTPVVFRTAAAVIPKAD